ncbi:hypothetical protein GYMLUDRAFT_957800 [Collybiopsis luxurians FD-317 M1]|nr:hypothetical protein GYMLUDRAFT_957800 [Collybiopsis luxurians FD-317 M1]
MHLPVTLLRHRRNDAIGTTPSLFDASAVDPSSLPDPQVCLEQLKAFISDRRTKKDKKLHRMITDICFLYEAALIEGAKSMEMAERDGVAFQIFLPMMTSIVWSSIQCVNNQAPASSSGSTGILFRGKTDFLKELKFLRNELRAVYFIAMPYESPQVSHRGENAVVIVANIAGVLTALCDGVPVLGMLKPAAEILNSVCGTIQTLRGNNELAVEILQVVRDNFRMVVGKVQRHPAAQADAELRRDVNEYFRTLLHIIRESLDKSRKRSTSSRLHSAVFAQKDKTVLEDLRRQVQDARNSFHHVFCSPGTHLRPDL